MDANAFLIARLTDWSGFNLLQGQANLFFEGTFVGQTILNPKAFSDTLDISLGRDKSISIKRESIAEYSQKRTLGSNKIESRSFQTSVRNQKNKQINLTIYDQIPIAATSQITINVEELSEGALDEETGKVKWSFSLEPNQAVQKILVYQVKYPKDEKITLE